MCLTRRRQARDLLTAKLLVTADAYAGGQAPGSPALVLADHLRALAGRLEQG
ncbi:MAG: hypothetical protein HGA45_37400 [Chloroflexales bacterium]|nr:hypothetical protein [Chloroflexales bacterium]